MNKVKILLAGKCIEIEYLFNNTVKFLEDYVTEIKADYEINIRTEDIEYEKKKSEAEDIKEGIPIRFFSDEYLETLAIYRKIAELLIDDNILLFHGSVIAVDGEGYLFTAKSGTGKSTHTRLWREVFGNRAIMVNDDKPLLKISDNGVTVCGTPWDGKHHLNQNISVPLKGICILKRSSENIDKEKKEFNLSGVSENKIRKITKKEAYPMLLQQSYRSVNPVKISKSFEIIDALAAGVSLYELHCNMDRDAAITAYNGMK